MNQSQFFSRIRRAIGFFGILDRVVNDQIWQPLPVASPPIRRSPFRPGGQQFPSYPRRRASGLISTPKCPPFSRRIALGFPSPAPGELPPHSSPAAPASPGFLPSSQAGKYLLHRSAFPVPRRHQHHQPRALFQPDRFREISAAPDPAISNAADWSISPAMQPLPVPPGWPVPVSAVIPGPEYPREARISGMSAS